MALRTQKIDQQFVLSDSSVNVLGMRLLTEGYQIEEYLKNPIGYYGHIKDDGVLLKWEYVCLSGDQVLGKPVINLDHPRAERTINEIEAGFLNCASAGKIVVLDYDLEDNPNDQEDPIVVVKKWWNKEYSLVDNPGNRNAMKVELCDADENELNLADLVEIEKRKKNNVKMKTVTLTLTPELIAVIGLSDTDTTAEAVVSGINRLHGENTRLSTELETDRNRVADEKVSQLLEKGLSDGKINAETKAKLADKFKRNPVDLADVLESMQVYTPIERIIQNGGEKKEDLNLADKTWDELDQSGQLATLKQKNPAIYDKKLQELKESKKKR